MGFVNIVFTSPILLARERYMKELSMLDSLSYNLGRENGGG